MFQILKVICNLYTTMKKNIWPNVAMTSMHVFTIKAKQ